MLLVLSSNLLFLLKLRIYLIRSLLGIASKWRKAANIIITALTQQEQLIKA